MDELQEIFGEDSLSYADFSAKLAEKNIKLANLKSGGYVDKEKFNKLSADFAKYKQENDVTKYADYDTIKAELEVLRAEKEEAAYISEAAAANVDERFRKFVVSEVKGLVTDKKDFKTSLAEYIKENPQFVTDTKTKAVFSRSSSENLENGKTSEKSINSRMNKILRGARQ